MPNIVLNTIYNLIKFLQPPQELEIIIILMLQVSRISHPESGRIASQTWICLFP